ncbi:PREDICTED: uncharacterized protein LOC104611539 isoform X2 [Nelumbo nucifera]|uniref:Uncharacterized protein LOC104611539 isoform X2 n=1 Tax=Nelumbo nucifera TaxID=4432 RepID=A0A1U8B7C6_NELNU|nr:PREDICTED: uncharacterized protein LOC104611539 isoform X2 [Nelumbo nucifera]
MALLPLAPLSQPLLLSHFLNPNPQSPFLHNSTTLSLYRRKLRIYPLVFAFSGGRNLTPPSSQGPFSGVSLSSKETTKLYPGLFHLAASAILFIGFAARACTAVAAPVPVVPTPISQKILEQRIEERDGGGYPSVDPNAVNTGKSDILETVEDEELKAALESWKSKTYALTVPLRIVSLRGSLPPSWIKDFMQVQGRRLKLRSEFRGSLGDIFSDLNKDFSKTSLDPRSSMAADIVTVGDSWLSLAIKKGIIEPMEDVESQDWFKGLSDKWKAYLCRNSNGELDSNGKIWGAPYRWGSIVIAYKKSKFQKHNLSPIEDWGDLWRPDLAGKISMVDSPREVVGAVLKYMGASYNTKDFDSEVPGGRNAVMQNLALLQKQVRLFDSVHYLKAFGVGDVWVAVGWSSDVLPAAKRMSNIAIVVPKSGASLWADLWAIPSASRFSTSQIGGRIRGPSPLIHQWIEFCLQVARALPFKQEVIPGASPSALEDPLIEESQEFTKGKPKLDSDLVAGVPPPEILARNLVMA